MRKDATKAGDAAQTAAAQDSASRLAQVAKQQQRRERAADRVDEEEFSFDLDLNPDL